MPNDFFVPSGSPSTGSQGSSSVMRGEFNLIKAAFDKLCGLTGNSLKFVRVNSGESAFEAVSATGTGSVVMSTSPTLVTPALGAATATSLVASAGVTGSQLTSTVAIGTPPLVVTSTTQVPNLYVARAALADLATTATTATSATSASTATLASTVTTNANLTGPITSSGNATSVASQTGTGSKFVMDTSPTLVTPAIGVATGLSLTLSSTLSAAQLTSTVSTGTAPLTVASTTKVTNLNADLLDGIDGAAFWTRAALPVTSSTTFTPVPTPSVGAFGSITVNNGNYASILGFTFFEIDVSTTIGTASGNLTISLPTTPTGSSCFFVCRGREINNGAALTGIISSGSTAMAVTTDANFSPIVSNARFALCGFYS